jgi:hypothetical protein
LTTEGTHFVYRSKSNQFLSLDIAKGQFMELMPCKNSQGLEDICYSGGVFYLLWSDQGSSSNPNHDSYILESWIILDQAQQNGVLKLKNIKPLALKDVVDKHSLLVCNKGNNIILMAMDPLLKKTIQTEFSIEEDRTQEDSHILGKPTLKRLRFAGSDLLDHKQADLRRRRLIDFRVADSRLHL